MTLIDELVALERGFWEATGDASYYADHMADDGLAVFSIGLMDKDAAIASTSGSNVAAWSDVRIADPRTLPISDDCVALIYKGSASRDGESYVAHCSTVYKQRGGAWKMILHQQSPHSED